MAKQSMLKFVTVEKQTPEKRAPNLRTSDFDEIYRDFAASKAAEQSGRCSQCGVPYCQSHCPLHNNIPDWLRMTAEGPCKRRMSCRKLPIHFPKSVAASAHKIVCAKAIALSSNQVTVL